MADRIVDLRSDTVTRPTAAMRSAMANAEVGDDVFGDDPTVRRDGISGECLGVRLCDRLPDGDPAWIRVLHDHAPRPVEIRCERDELIVREGAATRGIMRGH